MTQQTVINALIRAVRTFFQAAIPVYIAGIAGATDFAGLGNTTLLQAASIAGVIAALSFVMNVLEGLTNEPLPRG